MIKNKLQSILKHKGGCVVMIELPAEKYFESSSASVKLLTNKGFEGVYISFQRPFQNISSLFKQQRINLDKLFFIDIATAFSEEVHEKNPRNIHISPAIDIDELVRAIYTSLPKLNGKRKFIFIDSLTTISLYKPLSEVMRFSEFLIRLVKKQEIEDAILIFNVAKDLTQKKFIKDIAFHVDEVVAIQ